VRFAHCDPAGIVFYPRFFELFSSALEDWFQTGSTVRSAASSLVERNLRVPSLSITAEFLRPCRMGEFLDIDLWVARLGRSSFELALAGSVSGKPRLRGVAMCVIDFATFNPRPFRRTCASACRLTCSPSDGMLLTIKWRVRLYRIPCPVTVAATFPGFSGG